MPRRDDIHKILLIGSGPIIIGQACEFDYSGTQACKALREEGYHGRPGQLQPGHDHDRSGDGRPHLHRADHLARSSPRSSRGAARRAAADARRPDRPQPRDGPGPQHGVLEKFGVEMIGANAPRSSPRPRIASCSRTPWRRSASSAASGDRGHDPRRGPAGGRRDRLAVRDPAQLHPGRHAAAASPTTARSSTGLVAHGLESRPSTRCSSRKSVIGWKEFELEVMRDVADNVVIICSIENFDPMGVHTGDSITVAPAQTLTDKEYQRMRDAAIAVIREIGVETGGINIQFAIHPTDGPDDRHRDEPAREPLLRRWPRRPPASPSPRSRPSWPSATASTSCRNDITRETPACFEPTIDYVVTKMPRFAFEKFPEADPTLTTQMKIGRRDDGDRPHLQGVAPEGAARPGDRAASASAATARTAGARRAALARRDPRPSWPRPTPSGSGTSATPSRTACRSRRSTSCTKIDPWFLDNMRDIVELEDELRGDRRPRRGRRRRAAPQGEAVRLLRPPVRPPLARHRDWTSGA